MLPVKITFKLVYFFSTRLNLSQPRSICFNLDQFGAGLGRACRASQNTNNKLLSNTPNCYVCAGKFRRYLLMGKV